MRLNAYVLAGDPAWAAHSLRSYYGLVDRVVVSFDADGRSWSGRPLRVDEAVAALRAADPDGKLVLLPGHHSDPDRPVLDVETEHRQEAVDAAGEGADWVLQLDADEILLSPEVFARHLRRAAERGARALDYPLRDFYQDLGGGRYLEHCGRFWTSQSAYPGPVAVEAGIALRHCRQVDAPHYRVDTHARNTDPAHAADAHVHAVVDRRDAIAHMSWVRTEDEMRLKAATSGYAGGSRWARALPRWRWRREHPWLTAAAAPVRGPFDRFRVADLGFTR